MVELRRPQLEIVQEVGLADRLKNRRRSLADLAALQEFRESVLANEGKFNEDVGELLSTALSVSASGVSGALWDAVYRWLSPELENVVATETVSLPVAVYWLDVPEAKGATARVSVSKSSDTSHAVEVKIAGVGGGPSSTLRLSETIDYETTKSEMLVLSAPAVVQHIRVVKAGDVVATFPRVVNTEWDSFAWEARPLSSRPAIMGSPLTRRFVGGGGSFTPSLDVERGTRWESTVGVDLKQVGSGLVMKSAGRYTTGSTFTYTLPAGHRYLAERPSSLPCWFWTVDPA